MGNPQPSTCMHHTHMIYILMNLLYLNSRGGLLVGLTNGNSRHAIRGPACVTLIATYLPITNRPD